MAASLAGGVPLPAMSATIWSGEVFLLNGQTGGELRQLPFFLNQNIRVLSAAMDRVYVAIEPPVCQEGTAPPCSVWCFRGDTLNPELCQEFEGVEGSIRQIAIGDKHLLVLTHEGTLYSRGIAVYGSTGHGGAREVPDFRPVPALQGLKVSFVAAGPNFSLAITFQGDVYSWGQAFEGETGLFTQVEAVPRFAHALTTLRITEVSCGHGHVLARTEAQQCVTWGENTCGQLGIGRKCKPTFKPQILDMIPSQVLCVSAGWAHSVAVGTDGRVYAWGLNSHGQLGVGDSKARLAPHLLHNIVDVFQVESAHAARLHTVFKTEDRRALLCGQVPRSEGSVAAAEFAPHRPGERDPEGCCLSPVPINLIASGPSQISEITAFNGGAMCFARSTVYKVVPNLAPTQGGSQVRAYVTGLPFEQPSAKEAHQCSQGPLIQDTIPVKVRLKSSSPSCDMVVPGRIVAPNLVEFTTPNISHSPLGAVVEQGSTMPVQIRVSVDGGFTWTPDRNPAPSELDLTALKAPERTVGLSKSTSQLKTGLREFKSEFAVSRKASTVASQAATVLWVCSFPSEGPSHVEPVCAPVGGGTELLLHVAMPHRMPANSLTVKFVCTPLHSIGNAELEAAAPMRRDGREIINPCKEELTKLPLAGKLEVPVIAWLDHNGQGVRCVSPPFDAEIVQFYRYSIELSLDGRQYLSRALPFSIFDLHVMGLEPNLGSLLEPTQVRIRAAGMVSTDIHRVRLDFPAELRMASRTLPATFDHALQDIVFTMPDLAAAARQRAEEARQEASLDAVEGAEPHAGIDSAGGLEGIQVFVELSLNGQNFSEDRVAFTYFGQLRPSAVSIVSVPEGHVAEVKEDPKAAPAKGKKVVEEQKVEVVAPRGAKLGCQISGLDVPTRYALMRVELATKGHDEEPKTLRVIDLPAVVEMVTLPAVGEEPAKRVRMLTAQAPAVRSEDLPAGSALLMRHFQASFNGQSFESCGDHPPIRLEAIPAEHH